MATGWECSKKPWGNLSARIHTSAASTQRRRRKAGRELRLWSYANSELAIAPNARRRASGTLPTARAFKVLFDFFQGLALGLGQEKHSSGEVDDGKASEQEEHCRISVIADDGQKDRCERGRDYLVYVQRDAHAVGADTGRHQL